jgi:hypothetical protein
MAKTIEWKYDSEAVITGYIDGIRLVQLFTSPNSGTKLLSEIGYSAYAARKAGIQPFYASVQEAQDRFQSYLHELVVWLG